MIVVDIVPPAASEADVKAHYYRVDLTDYGQVVASFTEHDSLYKGMDAVIHLAAIPSPGHAVSLSRPPPTRYPGRSLYLVLFEIRL